MRSTGTGIHATRYRQYGTMENEEMARQGLEWESRRSMKDGEKKKSEGSAGVKDRHVSWKSLVVKLVLFSLTLAAFFMVWFPYASFYSQKVQTPQQLKPSASHAKKVAWMTKPNYIDDRYRIQGLTNWSEVFSLIAPLKRNKNSGKLRIGLVNFESNADIQKWQDFAGGKRPISFTMNPVRKDLTWSDLYPEWIDEEELYHGPKCPSVSLPEVKLGTILDLVVARIPCQKSHGDWSRDVARLHVHLATGRVAYLTKSVHVLLLSSCVPISNLFTCGELLSQMNGAWLFEVDLGKVMKKLTLPVGSCKLAVPLKRSNWHSGNTNAKREAYATILHSAQLYVCGAIVVAQSIRMTGSTRDLVILVDENIHPEHREGLEVAGWIVKEIQRIRNPKAEPESYNEWNYSKFRLWQLTSYDKIIFIDADLLILQNIDFLFELPEISATGNNATLFNSGVMVIEPSNCTFQLLMDQIDKIVSYNGGDQGFLNEVFTWWHRLPKHMNYLKHFWSNDTEELELKTQLFGADPAELYVLHYLGLKPWLCFRDYDCNWNVEDQRSYASDVAHARWWKVHDLMPEGLQKYCLLRTKQKASLEWDRRQAEAAAFPDEHWKRNITDQRLHTCYEKFCFWESMLWHWGDTNYNENASSSLANG
eukprot:c24662_g1_i1 orf=738-2681(+)